MKYKGKTEALELPDYFKFGIELEPEVEIIL